MKIDAKLEGEIGAGGKGISDKDPPMLEANRIASDSIIQCGRDKTSL